MASRAAFLLLLNIVFFTMVSSTYASCPTTPSTPETPTTPTTPKTPSNPSTPTPPTTPTTPTTPTPPTPPCTPTTPSAPKVSKGKCPNDTLKLGVCANLVHDVVHLAVGTPPKTPCCTLIKGLADLEAAVCLCTAIKAKVLGNNLNNIPVSLSLLLNYCGKRVPSGFQCA